MGDKTSIEWAANADGTPGATWNPVRARDRETGKVGTHCVHASEGCRFCYAERHNQRGLPAGGTGLAYTKQNEERVDIFLDEKMLNIPLRRRKPTTYFVSSLTDVFADFVPVEFIYQMFGIMAACRQHTFIVLTKRSLRMRHLLESIRVDATTWLNTPISQASGGSTVFDLLARPGLQWSMAVWPLPNVWLVASCEDQDNANERIPDLLATPAAVRGVSCEPLIGPIDLTALKRESEGFIEMVDPLAGWRLRAERIGKSKEWGKERASSPRLDWVIAGGESGPNARPMHPDWPRVLRDQCATAAVQWGEWAPVECAPGNPTRTERVATWWNDERWDYDTVTPTQHVWEEDEPDVWRFGKRAGGRLLDGVTHDARPQFGARA